MSLPKFIVGMIFALAIVVAWSWLGGASLGMTLMRVIICAGIIQAGYFVLVYAMIARSAPTQADRLREAERKLSAPDVTEGEKLGNARRSLH
ncbi:exopolysaccharide production repressor exox [Mesorhizobium sp. WSM4312]|uniref:exopolysaccharide production repressor exox n=1 Tax=unclassified Mesorhizobium TaxID=325217 RepID=UPI000BB0894B|nr:MULTISPECIES: exopolysaccharide production repressor exox [unclassified Mesorhizobium]PBB27017.1 exopolysaccharide production repressor exox [Mesorhizobium sp. WSM4304]PBB69342.1 exopolysaccharide production repressor exox [Mesorhizobium sp. WSM4312]PBB76621.1 exopolysaccharide production repressor exox [Mesorhizobium sp. WSM4308]PBC22665.1 exopolysaccharide production repressor exox [Mesorhizobium sp. WSM4311]TRC75022.1 exopolysaccharide production repressor exox [Mesorhizobium sp. WSM4315